MKLCVTSAGNQYKIGKKNLETKCSYETELTIPGSNLPRVYHYENNENSLLSLFLQDMDNADLPFKVVLKIIEIICVKCFKLYCIFF